MAVDNRPFKSKEQDGQGNEVIIRDQQLVEQGTATTMASGACFETRDVDDRPVKIPRDNMMNIVLECIGIILNDSSRNLGTNVQKALGLQGNTVGHSTVADFASVLGVNDISNNYRCFYLSSGTTDTGISVNSGYFGRTLLVLGSGQWDAGDNTCSFLWLIRCGYSGNHIAKEVIKEINMSTSYPINFGVTSNGTLSFTVNASYSVAILRNK